MHSGGRTIHFQISRENGIRQWRGLKAYIGNPKASNDEALRT